MTLTLEQRNAKFDAAKELVRKGWTQGQYKRRSLFLGRPLFCLVGALREVVDPNEDYESYAQLRTTVDDAVCFAGEWGGAVEFNDATGRKKRHVLAMLDIAKGRPLYATSSSDAKQSGSPHIPDEIEKLAGEW